VKGTDSPHHGQLDILLDSCRGYAAQGLGGCHQGRGAGCRYRGELACAREAEPAVGFVVLGIAQPQGSKRAFRTPGGRMIVADSSAKARPWRQEVASVAAEAWGDRPLLTGPVTLALSFWRARPRGHYGSGSRSGVVRPSAPAFPTTKPDSLKLGRAIEDSLTSIVFRDDAQVVEHRIAKRWGTPPRVEVAVFELAEARADGE